MAVLFSTVQVNSMSLNEALGSKNIELNFNSSGKISYTNTSNETTSSINNKDYLFENNTYFLHSNTLPIVTNTVGGGSNNIPSVLASIKGNCNISLQYLPSNGKVSNSITFSGDNSNYKGILYLHPGINDLIFTSENSVINNINVPNTIPNNGKDKDTKPFIKTSNYKLISLILPDNSNFGKLNINGKLTVNLINNHNKPTYLTFTEINKSSKYSLAVHDKIDLRIIKNNYNKRKLLIDINITDGSNNQMNSNNSSTKPSTNQSTTISISELIMVPIKQINDYKNQIQQYESKLDNTIKDLNNTKNILESTKKSLEDKELALADKELALQEATDAKTKALEDLETAQKSLEDKEKELNNTQSTLESTKKYLEEK